MELNEGLRRKPTRHEGRPEDWRQEPLHESRIRILPGAFTEETALSKTFERV